MLPHKGVKIKPFNIMGLVTDYDHTKWNRTLTVKRTESSDLKRNLSDLWRWAERYWKSTLSRTTWRTASPQRPKKGEQGLMIEKEIRKMKKGKLWLKMKTLQWPKELRETQRILADFYMLAIYVDMIKVMS